MSIFMSNKKEKFILIDAKTGIECGTKWMTSNEFLELNQETLKEFKGLVYWIPGYPKDNPKTVKSNEWSNYSADLRFCVGSHDDGDGMETRHLFIPRNVAKGNMKKIFIDLGFEEYYGGIGRHFKCRATITKVGKMGWLISQQGGVDC